MKTQLITRRRALIAGAAVVGDSFPRYWKDLYDVRQHSADGRHADVCGPSHALARSYRWSGNTAAATSRRPCHGHQEPG